MNASLLPDRYRLLLEHTSDVVFEATAEGTVTWVSPSVLHLSGFTPDEIVGRAVIDFVELVDRDDIHAHMDRLLAGNSIAFEGRMLTSTGAVRWVAVTAAPLFDDDGEVTGAVGNVRDVHDAVQARIELATSEEHYRLLADHVGDVVFRLSPELEILWVSPSVHHVLGWEPEALIGTPLPDLVHPDDWARMHPNGDRLIRRDRPVGPRSPLLLRVRRDNGLYCWVSARPRPVLDDDGALVAIVTVWTDVSELVAAREASESAALRLRATLDSLFDPHVVMRAVRDRHGTIIDFVHLEVNDAACHFHNRERDELIGARLLDIEPDAVGRLVLEQNAKVVETGVPLILDDLPFGPRASDGSERRYDVRSTKVGEAVSNTWRDVTDRHVFEERLSHLATHDSLTLLANRAALVDDLGRALTTFHRSNRPVGVIMLDLDHFKAVNDTAGHSVGDQLLKASARRLEATVRGGDLVARLGGDEFVIVMRELSDPKEAFQAGLRIVEAFREPITAGGMELRTTASVGIAISTMESRTEDLLREADAAMYRAKESGRDQASIFNDDLRIAATARIELEKQLRPAWSLGELAVYYQPEIDLTTGRVCAVEALLRWHHPSGELYSASRFIDLAEDIGLIVDSGNWVMREACKRAASWALAAPDVRVCLRLNLSKQQLSEASLIASFDEALDESGLDPALLCVEIREEALLRGASIAHTNLRMLHRRGVGLAIDNFGTGYAALSYLRDHKVDTVKIDRSFIVDIGTNAYSRHLVAGLAAFAQQLGLSVSAEGVETHEQMELLMELGCASAQGYLFCAPVAAEAVLPLLQRTFAVG